MGSAGPVAAQDTYLARDRRRRGDPEHGEPFHKWATAIVTRPGPRAGLPDANITYLADKSNATGPDRRPVDQGERRQGVRRPGGARPSERRSVHRPLRPRQLRRTSGGVQSARDRISRCPTTPRCWPRFARRGIVFVNTASSSGEFLKGLAGPGRTIVTATRTGGERNETRFPGFFVEAFTGDGADRDRNGRISVQEAFEYARTKVQQTFEQEGIHPERACVARRRRRRQRRGGVPRVRPRPTAAGIAGVRPRSARGARGEADTRR